MYKQILVCLDGSKLAEQILPYAVAEAMKFGSTLVLLQVINLSKMAAPVAPTPEIAYSVTPELLKQVENGAKEYLKNLTISLKAVVPNVEVLVIEGPPGHRIVEYAQNNGIDQIALATHGSGGIKRALLGSVADYVIRNSALPILVIKPKGE